MRRITALILQLALLVLPLSGIRAQDEHCAGSDHAPVTTMDLECHSMPSCASVVMRAEAPISAGPRPPIQVPAQPLAHGHGTVTRAPEPPPPRA